MRYPKEVVLKNGSEAIIRPLESDDQEHLRQFYRHIPESDRWYIRLDVTQPDVIRKWVAAAGSDRIFSVVALANGEIVGHARLTTMGFGATRHIGRLRIMVAPDFRQLRLGTWMLLDLIQSAMDRGLEELRADFVADVEAGAIEAARKLDFFKRAVLEDYIRGPGGETYDMWIMTKTLHKTWADF